MNRSPLLIAIALIPGAMSAQDFCVQGNPYPLGSSSYTAELVDVNADGNLDIVASLNTAGMQVFLGDGQGGLTPGAALPVGIGVISIASFDANGDGHADLAAADTNLDRVYVLVGDGAGAFVLTDQLAGGNDPYCTVTADMDEDGYVDVLSANRFSGNITLWRGNGDGTFATATSISCGNEPSGLRVVDLDLDGDLDCVVANRGSNDLWVFRGDGQGGLAKANTYPTGGGPIGLDVADINGDGLPDVAVANHGHDTISLFLGTGTMDLTANGTLGTQLQPEALALVDLDGDGLVDVAVENSNSDTISLYHGHGDGTFAAGQHEPAGDRPHGLDAADLDHDGLADVVTSNLNSNDVWVHMSDPCPMQIDGVSPTSAQHPGLVTVTGSHLQHVTSAAIQGIGAAIAEQSANSLTLQPAPGDPGFVLLDLTTATSSASETVEMWPSLKASTTGVGGVVETELQLGASGIWALALGASKLSAPLSLPPCWYGLFLDPTDVLVIVDSGLFPTSAPVLRTYPVPNNPAHVGLQLHLQAWTTETFLAPYEVCSFTNEVSIQL